MRWRRLVTALAGQVVLLAAAGAALAQELSAPEPMARHFPGLVLMEAADLNPSILAQFADRDARSSDPWALTWVQADFDGNGAVDHAALLRTPRGSGDPEVVFAVLLAAANGEFEVVLEQRFGGLADYAVIGVIDAGKTVHRTEAIERTTSEVRLRNPGLALTYVGKAEIVYFWDASQGYFDTIQTAD